MKTSLTVFEYSEQTNGNCNSPDFNKTIYYCSIKSTSENFKGCPLGRSYKSKEDAQKDLIGFVEFESEITLLESV